MHAYPHASSVISISVCILSFACTGVDVVHSAYTRVDVVHVFIWCAGAGAGAAFVNQSVLMVFPLELPLRVWYHMATTATATDKNDPTCAPASIPFAGFQSPAPNRIE
jgi:hypothetical protein